MAEAKKKSVFETLNGINVNDKTEKKNGLTYLSWAWAWGEVKKNYPEATYTVYENEHGWNYFTDGRTCWVKTGVTVEGIEHIEYLPVMDYKNRSILADNVTSFDVNKAIQRSLTKAIARHGLGLYIYAGEDLPSEEAPVQTQPKKPAQPPKPSYICERCQKAVVGTSKVSVEAIVGASKRQFGHIYCLDCGRAAKAELEAQKAQEEAELELPFTFD